MSNNEEDRESTKTVTSAWRKVAVWIAGAALLAFVGYRGGLGSAVAGTAGATPATSIADAPHVASSTAEASADATPRTAAPRAFPPPAGSEDTPVASAATGPLPPAPPASGSARTPEPTAASAAITADGKVILNLAAEADLRKLPGIGRARARAILEQRERLGRFRRVEDLLRIKGIGPKRLTTLRPRMVLDPP